MLYPMVDSSRKLTKINYSILYQCTYHDNCTYLQVFGKSRLSALINEAIHRGNFLLNLVQRHECLHVVVRITDLNLGLKLLNLLLKFYVLKFFSLIGLDPAMAM